MVAYWAQVEQRRDKLAEQLADIASTAGEDAAPVLTAGGRHQERVDALLERSRDERIPRGPWHDLPGLAWPVLHDWEESNDQARDLETVHREVEEHAGREASEPRRERAKEDLEGAKGLPADKRRQKVIAILDALHTTSEHRHVTARRRAQGIIVFGVVLVLLAGALVLMKAPLLPGEDPYWVAGVVMLLGAAGGLLSGYWTLYIKADPDVDTYWFDPAPTLMIAKLAAGLLFGYVAAFLLAVGLIQLGTETEVGLLPLAAVALLGGFAQEALTRFLDKKADAVFGLT